MRRLFEVVFVLFTYVTFCDANSAGVGIPCSTAAGGPAWTKLGHPQRGNLKSFQTQIDAAQGDAAKNVIKEERLKAMHELENQGYVMYWTMPPVHSGDYTISTGYRGTAGPAVWTPGSWMNIYVTAHVERKKFTGLILYAVDNAGNTVGEWSVDPNSPFRYGADAGGSMCVTHRNADLKPYNNVFRFKSPAPGTGTITFHALVKVGLAFPVLDGNFYYPNDAGTGKLTLAEGGWTTQTWFEGPVGMSCTDVCAKNQNMECDLQTLKTVGNSRADFYAVAQKFSPKCVQPIMSGCGPSAPSVGTEGCFFHDATCGDFVPPEPVAEKDPCQGVQEYTGGLNLQPEQCIVWRFQNQNNGEVGRSYNDLYTRNERVKVCNTGTNTQFFQDQDSFNGGNRIVGKCAPPGGFTPNPTPSPPPPKVKGAITCEAVDTDPADGGRICACTGGNTLPPNTAGNTVLPPSRTPAPTAPGETWAPTSLNDYFPPAGNNPNSGTRSSPNIVLVGAAVLFTSINQIGGGVPKFLSVLSLALSVNAHNWMSSPSRANNGFNAYQTAPCPPKGSRIHFQVQAGQKFPMEFATGHSTPARGGTYLTVLKAEDEIHMIKHTRAVLDEYLASVPASEPPYMADFKSHHVGSTAGSTTTTNVRAQLTQQYAVGAQNDNIRNYGPNWGNKPARGAAIYPKKPEATKDDLRVKYTNPKYPWIISCHKFKLHEDKSEEADLVMMEIPVGSPVGQYIVQYSWNGYYDCTDVSVIDQPSTDFYGRQAGQVSFDKFDHCLWNPSYQGYQAMGTCHEVTKSAASAEACFTECSQLPGCYGVQVVPYRLPAELTAQNKMGIFQQGTKTYPARCNTALANAKADSYVCFPLKKGTSVVGSDYDISEDPYDSIFYGSCYIKGGAWEFDQPSGAAAKLPPADQFKFSQQECISCESLINNQNSEKTGRVPFWDVTFGRCEHCNRSVG